MPVAAASSSVSSVTIPGTNRSRMLALAVAPAADHAAARRATTVSSQSAIGWLTPIIRAVW